MSQTLPPLVVAEDDALAGVLDRVRQAGANGRKVDLVVPIDSALLLTAAEFRALRDALDRDRLAVTLRTDDPLRTQLARLLGIPVEAAPRSRAAKAAADRRAAKPVAAPPARSPHPPPSASDKSAPARPAMAGPPRANRFAGPAEPPTAAPSVAPEPAPPADAPQAAADEAPDDEAAAASGQATDDPDALWPEPPSPEAIAARRRAARGRRWGGRLLPVAPPAPQPDVDAEPATAAATEPEAMVAPDSAAANGEAADDAAAPLVVLPADERRRRRVRTLLIAAGALAAIVALVYLLLPGATVAVTLKHRPLAGDVVYDVTTTGQPLDGGASIAVPAETQTTAVTWEGQIPVTGVRVEPTDRASAPILFANPNDAATRIDAGTRFATETGVVFALVDAVDAPPRDPASGKAGQAQGTARAVDAGSGGNVGVGEIGGRLPNGVYFSNREQAASGGAEKRIPIVAKADFDTLRKQAAAALPQAAAAAFAKALPAGQAIVPATIAAGAGAETFSAAEGDATGTLSLKVVWQASALAYDQTAATKKIAEAAASQLGPLAPAGYAVDPDSVQPGKTTVAAQTAQGVRLREPVTVEAVAVLSQPQRRALAERLAGAEPAAVDAILRQTPQIDHFTVSYHPLWLPDRMPSNVGRIQIEIEP
ncbi:MAG TPA: hypothetical protein VFQ80_06545 [Thermomicrobiales bacterium]|nr:hypothetical protein [Thermomicrobiales bacterium]